MLASYCYIEIDAIKYADPNEYSSLNQALFSANIDEHLPNDISFQ
jgi:hypothetical protein